MPGVGKSTIGKRLAEALKRPFVDIDAKIEERYGSVPDYINTHGIEAFRAIETAVVAEFGKEHGQIIATGGGCVTVPTNKDLLRQNGRLYWLQRPLEQLPTNGRPLSAGGIDTLKALYKERQPLYADFADVTVQNTRISDTVQQILEDFHEAMHY